MSRLRPRVHLLLVLLVPLLAAGHPRHAQRPAIPTYIAPGEGQDAELARWALAAWQRASGGMLRFVEVPEAGARLRLYWGADMGQGGFGEMRPLVVDGRPGAAVFVTTDMTLLGPTIANRAQADPLYREAIVYLTCLHELGHGLGLSHTDAFADIMYSFQYGGDIPGYFARYRQQLRVRADIARQSGLSPADIARIKGDRAPRLP